MQEVIVYSKPHCPQCDSAKVQLKNAGFNVQEVSLLNAPEKLNEFKTLGFRSAPIIQKGAEYFTFGNLKQLIAA